MKKGELTINYLIVTILALIVLVIIAWIFRNQIVAFISSIRDVSSGLGSQLKDGIGKLS